MQYLVVFGLSCDKSKQGSCWWNTVQQWREETGGNSSNEIAFIFELNSYCVVISGDGRLRKAENKGLMAEVAKENK